MVASVAIHAKMRASLMQIHRGEGLVEEVGAIQHLFLYSA